MRGGNEGSGSSGEGGSSGDALRRAPGGELLPMLPPPPPQSAGGGGGGGCFAGNACARHMMLDCPEHRERLLGTHAHHNTQRNAHSRRKHRRVNDGATQRQAARGHGGHASGVDVSGQRARGARQRTSGAAAAAATVRNPPAAQPLSEIFLGVERHADDQVDG